MSTINTIIKVLNDLLAAEPSATKHLFATSVKLAKQAEGYAVTLPVVVGKDADNDDAIRLLGVINGISEALTQQRIAGAYDETGNLIKFIPYKIKEK